MVAIVMFITRSMMIDRDRGITSCELVLAECRSSRVSGIARAISILSPSRGTDTLATHREDDGGETCGRTERGGGA